MPLQIVKLLDPLQIVNIPGGLVPRGAYDDAVDYDIGDFVDYLGSSYVMYVDAPAGTLPTDTDFWGLVVEQSTPDKNYTQAFINQSSLVVPHNLDKYPAVSVVDSSGDEVEFDVTHDSTDQLTLVFSASFSGTVFCN